MNQRRLNITTKQNCRSSDFGADFHSGLKIASEGDAGGKKKKIIKRNNNNNN